MFPTMAVFYTRNNRLSILPLTQLPAPCWTINRSNLRKEAQPGSTDHVPGKVGC